MSKELEQKMAELRKKDNELFEKVNQSAIFFASESARLTPEMRQELFKFQKNLEGSSWEGSYEVIITAFTDRYGDASYNANLREKRADAVVKYLQEELGLTVAVRRLTAAHDQLNDHILDRRVEVSVKVLE
jgi:outer membrane protein OmpA-like peptidoglycan-associated protein